MAKKPEKPQHYAARAGKVTCTVYLDPAEHEILKQAAEADERSLTDFLRRSGLASAKKILQKKPKET